MKFIKTTATMFAIVALTLGISSCNVAATKAYGSVQTPATGADKDVAIFDKQVSKGIVILDFFATWCPPCKKFAPIFKEAAAKHTNILFIKVDVDTYANLTEQYGVRSMPTIIALKDGKKVETNIGAMTSNKFESWIAGISAR